MGYKTLQPLLNLKKKIKYIIKASHSAENIVFKAGRFV